MSTTADISVENGVAHVALNAGPVARLTVALLHQIDDVLSRFETDDAVEIVILSGKGPGFPSGLTEPEAGGDDHENRLGALCRRIEGFPKPVVALLTGPVVGGGAELALACHYRLVHREARIGFPNVRLGLVPRAGATQRLPRIVGAAATLELLLGGHLHLISAGAYAPLADANFSEDRYAAVMSFIDTLRGKGARPRPTSNTRAGFTDGTAFQATVNDAREKLDPTHDVAAIKIVSAVEAALVLPIDAGLAFEEACAEDCAETPVSKALAHVFHAEQTANAVTRRTDLGTIRSIAILGPGHLASQIALATLDVDIGVSWFIRDADKRETAVSHVRASLEEAVQHGRLNADRANELLSGLRTGDSPELFRDVDLVLRAARGLRGVPVPPNIPIAHCLSGSEPRLAMRFAPMSASRRLVEILVGPEGSESDLRTALGFARRVNALAIVERTSGQSVHDRLTQALWRASDALVDLGQSPFVIDAAMRDWGMALPPYALADHSGLELVARQERSGRAFNWCAAVASLDRTGTGIRFYSTAEKGTPAPDARVLPHIDGLRPSKPDMPASDIRRLLFGAMANEGARLLSEGVVQHASDIDLVSILSGLMPRWSGGAMHHACVEGLLRLSRAMAALPHPDAAFWTPHTLFAELIKNGRSFDDR